MTRLALLGGLTLALAACQMDNPAFGDTGEAGTDGDGDGDGDASTTLETGDGDGDSSTSTNPDTGDGDGDSDTSTGVCGDGQLDPGEDCDGSPVANGQCSVDCTIVCNPHFDNCNDLAQDGCETDLDGDGLNCGLCGTDCLGGGCEQGLCGAFDLAEAQLPHDVAIDGGVTVYWTDREAGTVSRKPIGGGAPELVASQLNQPMKLALGQERVFFTEWAAGQISSWNFGLNDAWTLQGQPGAWAVAAGGTDVFWAQRDQGVAQGVDQGGPGAVYTLVEGQGGLTGLAYASDFLAFISGSELGTVGVAWFGDGEPQILATGLGSELNEVATDGVYVYFTNGGSGTIEKINVETGVVEILAQNQAGPYGLVLDGDWIYWGNLESGQVMAIQLGNDQPVILAEGQTKVRGMDTNGEYLVWACNHLGGSVRGLVLP